MTNGKGLAYVGLILGLIGAGLGGYVFFDYTIAPLFGPGEPTPEDYSKVESWYVEEYSISPSDINTFVPLTSMNISFDTTETVTLYILYTSYVRITTASGFSADIRIQLNNTILSMDTYYVQEFGAAAQERFAVNMQNYIPALLPGIYNVTVWVDVDDALTRFFMNSLYVQTHT